MIVIKKSDKQEKFSFDKLSLSIRAANANTEDSLDIPLLIAEFQNIIVEKDYITTGQINVIIYGLLYSKKAFQTLKNFSEYTKYK